MSRVIAIDTETFFSSKLTYSIKTQIAEQYASNSLFHCYLVSACDGEASWAGEPSAFNWQSLNGQTLVSHNMRFDRAMIAEMVKRGQIPAFVPKAWYCTADLSAYCCNRRSLEMAVEHLFQTKLDKTARSDANGKHWPDDFSPEERTRMLEYAKADALWTWKLWDSFSPNWPAHERRLSVLTCEQGMRGVQINTELLDTYLMNSHDMLQKTAALLPWLRDVADEDEGEYADVPNKPTSVKAVADQCRRAGISCPPPKSKEPEEYEIWEAEHAPRHSWIQALTAYRSVNRLYKMLVKAKERLRPDGVLPFSLKYGGAHTMRWAGDAGINFQNFNRLPVLANEAGAMESNKKRVEDAVSFRMETGVFPAWVKYDIDFRHLIVARPGKKLVVSDAAQIEPRALAWLAGDFEFLKQVGSGMSAYEAHARSTMSWNGGNLKKENPGLYALAKARVLALGYGAGWEKFIQMAQDLAGLDIAKDDPEFEETINVFTGESKKVSGYGKRSREIVKEFRDSNPKIIALWRTLDEAFKRSIGENFRLTLSSGRTMVYEDVRAEFRLEKDRETGRPRRKTVFTASIGGRRRMFYSGKLCENATQATAREILAWHMLRLEDAGFPILFTVHDECVCEVDMDVQACEIEHIMVQTPDFVPGLPLAAEAKETPHYCK